MPYTIDDIHAAVLAQLIEPGSNISALCKTIDTFHGEAQDILDRADELITAMPACWVLYAGSTFDGRTSALQDNFNIMLVYMVRDIRADEQRASIYSLIEAGKRDLHGHNLGLYINPLRPGAIRMVRVTSRYAVYSHQLSTFFKS